MASSPWMKNLRKVVGIKREQRLELQNSLTSAVTTAWRVYWSEDNIARDLMQNFYDANRGSLSEVKVKVKGSDVVISGPAAFNLERLFYLGSEKGEDDAGEYGEGFKAAVLNLLRDHQVEVVALSGKRCLRIRLSEETVEDTTLQPLVYDFYCLPKMFAGSALLLDGCSGELTKALENGLDHFLYPENPLLGEELWSSTDGNFAIYRSTDACGYVFYRNQRRGTLDGIPLVLVIRKPFPGMETLIKKDRDRNAFGEKILAKYFQIFIKKSGVVACSQARALIVSAARECWVSGHPLVSELASGCQRFRNGIARTTWRSEETSDLFGDGFFARSSSSDRYDMLEYKRLEKMWEETGRVCLPRYFRYFGVLSAEAYLYDLRKTVALEHQREPTDSEASSIDCLLDVLAVLSPELFQAFALIDTWYTVCTSKELLGAMREYRGYGSVEVLLEQGVFESEFGDALSTFLHEHAHIRGDDGSRFFTDELTNLLGSLVRHRKELDDYEKRWNDLKTRVKRERLGLNGHDGKETGFLEYIASITRTDHLADALNKVPLQDLESIIRQTLLMRMVSVLRSLGQKLVNVTAADTVEALEQKYPDITRDNVRAALSAEWGGRNNLPDLMPGRPGPTPATPPPGPPVVEVGEAPDLPPGTSLIERLRQQPRPE
jgi:hypothetical protein